MRAGVAAGLILLALPAAAAANVPTVYYPGDPGYGRARVAKAVAPTATFLGLAAGLTWAVMVRGRRRAVALAALGCFFLVAVCNRIMGAPSQIEYGPAPARTGRGDTSVTYGRWETRPLPGEVSAEEGMLYAAGVSLGVAAWGIKTARRSVAQL